MYTISDELFERKIVRDKVLMWVATASLTVALCLWQYVHFWLGFPAALIGGVLFAYAFSSHAATRMWYEGPPLNVAAKCGPIELLLYWCSLVTTTLGTIFLANHFIAVV